MRKMGKNWGKILLMATCRREDAELEKRDFDYLPKKTLYMQYFDM
jgi:hypothetical protein